MSEKIKPFEGTATITPERIEGLADDLQMVGQYLLMDMREDEASVDSIRLDKDAIEQFPDLVELEAEELADDLVEKTGMSTKEAHELKADELDIKSREDNIAHLQKRIRETKELVEELKVGKFERAIEFLKGQLENNELAWEMSEKMNTITGGSLSPAYAEKQLGRMRILRQYVALLESKI